MNRREFLKAAFGAGIISLAARESILQTSARDLTRQADNVSAFSGGPGASDSFARFLSGLGSSGQVIRSNGTEALWAQLQHTDLGGVTGTQHTHRHMLNSIPSASPGSFTSDTDTATFEDATGGGMTFTLEQVPASVYIIWDGIVEVSGSGAGTGGQLRIRRTTPSASNMVTKGPLENTLSSPFAVVASGRYTLAGFVASHTYQGQVNNTETLQTITVDGHNLRAIVLYDNPV